ADAAARHTEALEYEILDRGIRYLYLGQCSFGLEDYDSAIKYFQKAIDSNLGKVKQEEAWRRLGDCYKVTEKTAEAIEAYMQAVEILAPIIEKEKRETGGFPTKHSKYLAFSFRSIGQCAEKQGDYQLAANSYGVHLRLETDAGFIDRAKKDIARCNNLLAGHGPRGGSPPGLAA
ncbi:MAG TPA: tetratricopeptide repeat protein, partial [Alphaproteobacteria bacterium]|nr:tetratricopeptide repeat protein [Alphaproteobacteria bacterium]